MAWTEIMTSTHAALARAEWAIEAGTPEVAPQELWIATAQAMLAWLKAHRHGVPIWYDYTSVLRDFGAAASTASTRAVLRLHYRAANLDSAFQGTHHGPATGLAVKASALATSEEVLVALEATQGTIRALEGNYRGRSNAGTNRGASSLGGGAGRGRRQRRSGQPLPQQGHQPEGGRAGCGEPRLGRHPAALRAAVGAVRAG